MDLCWTRKRSLNEGEHASFSPYREAYPIVKTATSVGFDDGKSIRNFDGFIDYLRFQVYDFYYPYGGADKSKTDSISEVYRNDPQTFLHVVIKNVLTPTVMKAYLGREQKIKLIWSTQTLWNDCIYPMRDGTCGINYERNGSIQNHPQLGKFEHGVYTHNFINPSWMTKQTRT
jgi:hypothetical protein